MTATVAMAFAADPELLHWALIAAVRTLAATVSFRCTGAVQILAGIGYSGSIAGWLERPLARLLRRYPLLHALRADLAR